MPKQKKPDRRAVAQQRANDLKVMRADVAGIDVGAEELFVCAPGPEEGLTQVMVFGTTTPELMKMAEWLKQWKVASVAMESTGVYWIPPYEVLESQGRALFGMTGIDATAIDGVGVETMEAVISEYGSTLEKFPNEDAFVSHLRLAPHLNITGGKPDRKKRRSRASSTRVGN